MDAGSKLGLSDVQAELDRISSRETDSDLPNANETPATDGQDTWRPTHFTPLYFSPPPPQSPSTSFALPPSTLALCSITKMQGNKEGSRGKGKVDTLFMLPIIFHSPQGEELALSSPAPSPTTRSPPAPSLSLPFLAVTLRASICHCYIQDCLLHESLMGMGHQCGCDGWDEKKWEVGWKRW